MLLWQVVSALLAAPACRLSFSSPKEGQVFPAGKAIAVHFGVWASTPAVAERMQDGYVTIALDTRAGESARRSFKALGDSPIELTGLDEGVHFVSAALHFNGSTPEGRAAEPACVTPETEFQVGAMPFNSTLPASVAVAAAASCAAAGGAAPPSAESAASAESAESAESAAEFAVAQRAASVYYSMHPLQLMDRARVLQRQGYALEAAHALRSFRRITGVTSDMARWPDPPPLRGPCRPDRSHPDPPSPSARTDRKFVSFRAPAYGLNSQRQELLGMMMVAHALDRTLLLPLLDSDLIPAAGADGALRRPPAVPFAEVGGPPACALRRGV
jgi:hypothetical protein